MDNDEIPEPRDKVEIKTGDINADQGGTVNIAAGDILQTIQPTQAAEARERRLLQEHNLAKATRVYAAAQDRLREELANLQSPPSPYKGLHYFDPTDQAIFFGRQSIADKLTKLILQPHHRLTVLHAPSGAGKTSLIRAGLIPRLLQQGCIFLWTTPLPYPANIYAPLTDLAPSIPDFIDLHLHDFFSLAVRNLNLPVNSRLVLFIDQFERLFSHANSDILPAIERDLVACLRAEDSSLPLRIVIAIRSDFLWALDQLRGKVHDILRNRELLQPLSGEQALQAIISPLHNEPVQWQPDAAQAVLAYLNKDVIEPPHLQLICSQLYEKAIQLGQASITYAEVAEYNLEALHREYLRSELALLEDEELGWALLKRLVDLGGVSLPQLVPELPSEMQAVKETLIERRVLRQSKTSQGLQVEIAHETLAQEILAHELKQEIRRKAARELINRGLEDWQRHTTLWIRPV